MTCQACGSSSIHDYVAHDEGHYLRCSGCGLVFNADAQRLMGESGEHYDDAEYFAKYRSRFPRKLRKARQQIHLLQGYAPTGRLLDIGCGIGETLIAAREAGFEAVGLDVGEYPVQHCRELGFEVHRASITDTGLPSDSFDVVTMWDVIEHIPRTADGLTEVARILKPGGIAVMVTPSAQYLKAHLARRVHRHFRGLWAKTHFVYHSPGSLGRVCRESGLTPLRTPVMRRGAMMQGGLSAAGELIVAPFRRVVWLVGSATRMSRNLYLIARKDG